MGSPSVLEKALQLQYCWGKRASKSVGSKSIDSHDFPIKDRGSVSKWNAYCKFFVIYAYYQLKPLFSISKFLTWYELLLGEKLLFDSACGEHEIALRTYNALYVALWQLWDVSDSHKTLQDLISDSWSDVPLRRTTVIVRQVAPNCFKLRSLYARNFFTFSTLLVIIDLAREYKTAKESAKFFPLFLFS